jgi:uncharacterized FlaG/YvyC family protein
MPDNLIPQVGRADNPLPVNPVQASQTQAASTRQALTPGAVTMQADTHGKDQAEVKKEKKFSSPHTDITLKFKIDEETNDVTILMLDRETRKVVRTIPPEEMTKLDPGQLLELFT